MKKRVICLLLCTSLTVISAVPAMASGFSLAGISGNNTLSKKTEGYTAKTAFGVGKEVTAVRYVKLTVKYTRNGTTYTKTDDATAATNTNHYTSTTATVTVNRPSSNYTLKSATSNHKTTCKNTTNTETINK